MYYEVSAYELLSVDYILEIAEFMNITLPANADELINHPDYIRIEKEYTQGPQFYITSQTKLHPVLNEYQNGVIAAYKYILSTLEIVYTDTT